MLDRVARLNVSVHRSARGEKAPGVADSLSLSLFLSFIFVKYMGQRSVSIVKRRKEKENGECLCKGFVRRMKYLIIDDAGPYTSIWYTDIDRIRVSTYPKILLIPGLSSCRG